MTRQKTLITGFDMSQMMSESKKDAAAVPPDDIAAVLNSAEREIAAFYTVVTATYGPEQAELAALDWLKEMERADLSAQDSFFNWRGFTYLAAVKLAERVCPCKLTIP